MKKTRIDQRGGGTAPNRLMVKSGFVARALGVSRQALAIWRRKGFGPPFVQVSDVSVRYPLVELHAWVESRMRRAA